MNARHPFDAEDPFGTRPDEKPPQGWDAAFWEGVRERIKDRRLEPDPPETAPSSPFTLVTWVLFAAFCTAVLSADLAHARSFGATIFAISAGAPAR